MKKIYNILLTAIALLALAPVVSAQMTKADDEPQYGDYSINGKYGILDPKNGAILQWPKDNGLHQKSDFAYSKDISSPQSDGTYWIKLESFSTGSASYIEAAVPADIVLVLDLSSSMADNFIAKDDYYPFIPPHTPAAWRDDDWNNAGNAYSDQGGTGWTVYYNYNGTYYQVYEDQTTTTRPRATYYYMYFDVGSTRYYLMGDTIEARDSYPTNVTSATGAIYTGELYIKGETRLHALKRATCDFIDVIENNDKYEDEAGTIERTINGVPTRLGNRISIITFWSEANLIVSLPNGALNDASTIDPTISTAQYLKNQVNAFVNGSGTRPDLGIDKANTQLNDNPHPNPTASKTVVVFTDGEPYPNTGNANYNTAIASAYTTKNEHEATVFTVGLFSEEPGPNSTLRRFMNYMSSNALTAKTISDNATTAGFTDETPGYYKDASGENADLSAVFQEIAHQSGGSQTSLSAASSNVDVVSNSFLLPDNAQTSDIRVFVAKLKEMDAPGSYIFYEEIDKDHVPTTDDYKYIPLDEHGEPAGDPIQVNQGISVALETTGDSETPNTIKVTGFDYSSCYCGPVFVEGYEPHDPITADDLDDDNVDHYQGFKIIIMIPIHMNPDAVGGPNVPTNGTGSGIYVSSEDTEAFVPYESPKVSLPVNIYIKKNGLEPGESAKFSIERAVIHYKDEEGNWELADIQDEDWEYVSTVFVTRGDGESDPASPVVRVKGLPANINVLGSDDPVDVVYRISEEPWGWSYDPDDDNEDPQYTVTSKVDNPFEFSNKKKTDIELKVRHAESKATNSFDPDNPGVKYDDSKKRSTSE